MLSCALCACGDNLAAPVDAALPDALTYPAFKPDVPQVQKRGGSVMPSVRVVPVLFPNETLRTEILDFPKKLAAVWPAMVGEYGVGALTAGTPVDIPIAQTGTIENDAIRAFLTSQLDGTHPEWGPVDPATLASTVYTLFYPDTARIHFGGGTTCAGIGAYHDHIGPIVFAVIPRCSPAPWNASLLEQLTQVTSHELVEAATDPVFNGFGFLPDFRGDWVLTMFGAEVGDMCQTIVSSFTTPFQVGYRIQRSWSNESAAALHDPCVPIPPGAGPYFNAVPQLLDEGVVPNLGVTEAVAIPVGESRTIPVRLWSDAPTPGAWAVHVAEVEPAGETPALKLAFDRAFGQNGDTIHLTITATRRPTSGYAPFVVISSLGATDHVWAGGVAIQ